MKLVTLALLAAALPVPAFADQIQLLDRGDQSLSAFYASINSAKSTIDIATFLFEPCDSAPKLLLDALVKKARSGVKVRLILDAYSVKPQNKNALPGYLATVPNFQFRYFNDATTLLTANGRSHAKVFIVDGKTADRLQIVGGRNMTDDYFGLSRTMNYVDHDLLIRGASASEALEQYEALWSAGSTPSGQLDASFVSTCLKPNARDLEVSQFITQGGAGILSARPVRSCRNVEYALDKPGFDECQTCSKPNDGDDFLDSESLFNKRMTKLFLDFVAGTDRKLEITNQYYMTWQKMDSALATLREDHKSVSVYTNATGDIDVPSRNASFTCWIQQSAFKTSTGTQSVNLLTSKGKLGSPWSLSVPGAPWRIHAKSAVRDGADVLVSSYNIDPRSYNTNLESGVSVEGCPDLANDLSTSYQLLRDTAVSEKSCAACKSDLVPGNFSASVNCGGTPNLY